MASSEKLFFFHKNWNSNNSASSGYKMEFESLEEEGIKFICIVQ